MQPTEAATAYYLVEMKTAARKNGESLTTATPNSSNNAYEP